MKKRKILVTGGLGYIGSHTCLTLLEKGYEPIILDNLHNSNLEVINRINSISGIKPMFYQGDIRNGKLLDEIFNLHSIDAVIHFAGLKSVGESVQEPLHYYDNNVNGTLVLLESMKRANVKNFIFSSSATVYGTPLSVPITEIATTGNTTNPYGTSKYMVERLLSDLIIADNSWSITVLRYFNPVGAHSSGTMGEDPLGIPNNLAPYITQVAIGRHPHINIYGNDYSTVDGTGVRDYIHVMDLASGHIAALDCLIDKHGLHVYNLGTGKSVSVLEIISAFEQACGMKIPYKFVPRRNGDIAECWSNPEKANRDLKWKAIYSLQDMVNHSWQWQLNNPNGYR